MTTLENAITMSHPQVARELEETETVYFRCLEVIHDPPEVTTQDQMNIVEYSGTLDFWDKPEEDIYSESDGDAV